jgi:hypothetical protein
MKVLIVSSNQSHPTDAGNRTAIMGQVHIFQHLGCDVHFLFVDMALRQTDESKMKEFWGENYHVFHLNPLRKVRRVIIDKARAKLCHGRWQCDDHYPFGLEKYVEHLNNQMHFDAIVLQYMRLSRLLTYTSIPKKAIYTHDVFSYKDLRTGAPFYEACDAHEEAKAMQRCPNIFAIQEDEATYYSYLAPNSKIFTVYSHFDYHQQPVTRNKNILFLASRMEFNVNGILWFLDKAWPMIVNQDPELKLIIGGTVCEKIPEDKYSNIMLVGRVDSLDNFYQRGDVVINPVFQGTGLKIKTFEALSYGKVVIVHPHSSLGIYQRDTAPLLFATQPADWANIISDICMNKIQVQEIKQKDEKYIQKMNNYINSQYISFLSESH